MLPLGFEKKKLCFIDCNISENDAKHRLQQISSAFRDTAQDKEALVLTRSNSEFGTQHHKTLQWPAGNRKQLQMFF